MGGIVSRLEVVLDQEEGKNELLPLPAGSLLKGKVIIELPKHIQPASSSPSSNAKDGDSKPPPALELRLYGKEKVCMNRSKAQVTRGTASGLASKYAERPLLDLRLQWPKFPLTNDDGSIPDGTYVFPFRVQLPPSLPASTYYPTDDNRKRSKMRFRIQYKLTASISDTICSNKKLRVTSKYLWISAAAADPPPPVTPCIVEPVTREIKGGFFQGKGLFLFGAAVENCNLSSGANQSVHLHVACRNDSNTEFRRVRIQILERYSWGTGAVNHIDAATGTVRTSTTMRQNDARVLVTLDDVHLAGLTKERTGVLKAVMNTLIGSNSFASQQQRLQRQVYDDIMSDDSLIRVQLPDSVRESYAGQLLQVYHVVRIEFQTGSMFQAMKTPILELPLHITGHALPLQNEDVVSSSGAGKAYRVPTESATTGLEGNKLDTDVIEANTATPDVEAVANFESEKGGGKKNGTQQQQQQPNEIPMVEAVYIPDDAVHASTAVTADMVVLGGDAVLRQQASHRALTDLVPLAPPPSLPLLLNAMKTSINDYELVAQKSLDEEWISLFQKMSPDEFGSVIACVHLAFDQPRVALLLASHLHQGRGIQCADAAAAIRNAFPQHRAVMAQRLLPLCTDAKQNHERVRTELNEWERTVTSGVFEEVLR